MRCRSREISAIEFRLQAPSLESLFRVFFPLRVRHLDRYQVQLLSISMPSVAKLRLTVLGPAVEKTAVLRFSGSAPLRAPGRLSLCPASLPAGLEASCPWPGW